VIVKTAHTITRKLPACKTTSKIYSNIIAVVLLLFIPVTVFAEMADGEAVEYSKQTKIVYAAGEGNAVVITEGRITAAEGQSIKLLPGTHIKGGEKLSVSIVSREHQEARAYEAEKIRRQEFHTAVFARLKNRHQPTAGTRFTGFPGRFPFGGTALAQRQLCLSMLPVQPSVTFPVLCTTLQKNITLQNIHNLLVSAFRGVFNPLTSWGGRAETIKVLLC
jgi:hypothetical protein